MKKNFLLLLILLHSLLFVFLFYKQYLGLNLLVFELAVISSLLFIVKKKPISVMSKVVLAGTLLSGIMVVWHYSMLSIFINICSFLLLTGVMVYPEARSIVTSMALALSNFFQSFPKFVSLLDQQKSKLKILHWIYRFLKIALLPLGIIILFVIIYKASNPIFSIGLSKIADLINPIFEGWFKNFNGTILLVFILGFIISVFSFIQVKNKRIIDFDSTFPEVMKRKRSTSRPVFMKTMGLKNELRSALFLLFSLNILILILNSIDIYWVWFNFEWNGVYLKQFVHEGTFLLILSILISMLIVLFFFRGNLNFYAKNKGLKFLSQAWLAQNAILAISVAIRNFWYIKYFALAYKRIGVIFFLIATLYGIYTIYKKVKHKKTIFYLFRTNMLSIYVVLVFMTFFNWDIIIARYNFSHYKTSFVHLDFLSSLSYKALPYLDYDLEELYEIEKIQQKSFPFEEEYMSPDAYHEKIASRKAKFMTQWGEKNLKSWNFAEWNAYKKM